MKKLALALLALPLLMSSCTDSGSLPNTRPYTITIKSLGYKVNNNVYTITESQVELYSTAGAPDVRSIDYTAVMLDAQGNLAGNSQSTIVPQTGTLFGGGKGGYICTTTDAQACSMASPDAVLSNTGPGQWSQNAIVRALMPFEWAVIHNRASGGATEDPPSGNSAGWYVEFTFRAVQANGKVIQWKQNYQLVAPA